MSKLFGLLAAFLGAQACYAGGPELAVPPGFEHLDKRRTVVLDLHFRGRQLAPIRVEIESGKFQFVDGLSAMSMLPVEGLPDADLTAWHSTNVDKICSRMARQDCGVLFPETVAFIVDEDNFRIDAFVGPKYVKQESQRERLRPSHTVPSVTAFLDGSIAGDREQVDYFIQSDVVASLGSIRATVTAASSSLDTLRAREALIEAEHGGLRSQAGLFWTSTNSFLGRRRLVGVGTQSQWDTQPDRDRASGTTLEVILPERSRVDVIENGQLIWTGFYEPGSAVVETSNFPDGAYPVTLKVTGASGQIREEVRFFVKDKSLPSVGSRSFHVFAGLVGEDINGQSEFKRPIATASYLERLNDQFAVGGDLVAIGNNALTELKVNFAVSKLRVRSSLMLGMAGEKAVSSVLSFQPSRGTSFDLSARKLWSVDDDWILPLEDYGRQLPLPRSRSLQFLSAYTQVTGSLSTRVGKGNLRLQGSYSSSQANGEIYSYGPSIDYPISVGRRANMRFTGHILQTERTLSAFAGVRFFKALGGTVFSGRAGYVRRVPSFEDPSRNSNDIIGNVAVSSSKVLGETLLRGAAGLTRETYGHDAHLDMEVRSTRFAARAEVLQNINGLNGQTLYSGSFRTGIGISPDTVIVAGENFAPAAIKIVADAPTDSRFEVFVDGRPVGEIEGADSLSRFLEPYRDYEVSVRPKGRKQVQLNHQNRKVTLFPGGVVTLTFRATELFTIFGRLKDESGQFMGNTYIKTQNSIAQSDADGFFQIDVVEGDVIRVISDNSITCPFELTQGAFQKVGELQCN